MSSGPLSAGQMATLASGLVVPSHVADKRPPVDHEVTRDADGRRRVVFANDDIRMFKRAIDQLRAMGFQIILRCDDTHQRRTARLKGFVPCGVILVGEDGGYACGCSKVHLPTPPAAAGPAIRPR